MTKGWTTRGSLEQLGKNRPGLLLSRNHAPAIRPNMNAKTVLISGAGIAGPTLAFWLNAAGFKSTLIEHAAMLRTGGYVIDFWGLGYDIAERMGLAAEIDRIGYHIREMRIVDDRGGRVTGFGTSLSRIDRRTFRDAWAERDVTIAIRQDQRHDGSYL